MKTGDSLETEECLKDIVDRLNAYKLGIPFGVFSLGALALTFFAMLVGVRFNNFWLLVELIFLFLGCTFFVTAIVYHFEKS